jgi:phosphoketolase
LVWCVVGDGEAEIGAVAAVWHCNKFVNPGLDGAVLPVLRLNGCQIANPTALARFSDATLTQLFSGYGYKPYFVEGYEPQNCASTYGFRIRNRLARDLRYSKQRAQRPINRNTGLAHDRASQA